MDSPLTSFVSSFLVTIVGNDRQRGATFSLVSTMVVIVGWRAPGVAWMMKRRREASRYCNWRSLVGIKKVGDGVDWIVQYRADLHGSGSFVILGEDGQRQSNHGEHREGQ